MLDVLIFVTFVEAMVGFVLVITSRTIDGLTIGLCMFVSGALGVILILLRHITRIVE